MKKPRKSRKVTLAKRELAWRLQAYRVLRKMKDRYLIMPDHLLGDAEEKELLEIEELIEALDVLQERGIPTAIRTFHARELIDMAITDISQRLNINELTYQAKYLAISRWLREKGVHIPSRSSFSRYINKYR